MLSLVATLGGQVVGHIFYSPVVVVQDRGCPFVVVLGYPEFYPRFGFTAASRYGVRCEWTVPDDVFMMSIFDEEKMRGFSLLTS